MEPAGIGLVVTAAAVGALAGTASNEHPKAAAEPTPAVSTSSTETPLPAVTHSSDAAPTPPPYKDPDAPILDALNHPHNELDNKQ